MTSQTIRAMGFAWYRRDDWDALLRLFTDSDVLHRRYDDWLAAARTGEKRMQGGGWIVERIEIRPVPFEKWCRERGLPADAEARKRFCNEAVARKYGAN